MIDVGIVGLGRMGSRIAQKLAQSEIRLTAWDRNPVSVRETAQTGIAVAADARAVAAAAGIVITCVTEDAGVRQIFTGADGFFGADVRGKLFIEMSTLRPQTGRELAALVRERGAAFVDSPVLGSLANIPRGTLQALVGGSVEDLERARAVLAPLAQSIVHMGPVGSGYAMKLVQNLGLAAYVETLGEALALGASEGLDLSAMLGVLKQTTTANAWINNRQDILTGAADDVTLDIRTMRKDVVSALATGAHAGISMPVTAGTLAVFAAAVAAGWGDGDIGQIPRFVRDAIVQRFS